MQRSFLAEIVYVCEGFAMFCIEESRLRKLYIDTVLRRGMNLGPYLVLSRDAEESTEEGDVARSRWVMHRENCFRCGLPS